MEINLKEYLQENGISIIHVSRKLGYHKIYTYNMINGKLPFSQPFVEKVIEYFGLDKDTKFIA